MVAPDLAVAIGPEHEQRGGCRVAGEVLEQEQGSLIGPLEVVEHEHGRPFDAREGDEPADRLEEAVALALRNLDRCRGDRQSCAQFGQQPREQGRVESDLLPQFVGRRAADVVLERLHERLVRGQGLFERASPQDGRPLQVQLSSQL